MTYEKLAPFHHLQANHAPYLPKTPLKPSIRKKVHGGVFFYLLFGSTVI